MAIKKQVTETNGIVTEYHRIAMVKMDTNQQNTILVHSYLSSDGRQIEKDYEAGKYRDLEEGMMNWPYVSFQYLNTEYDGERRKRYGNKKCKSNNSYRPHRCLFNNVNERIVYV